MTAQLPQQRRAASPRSRRSCAAPAACRTTRPKARGGGSILEFRASDAILNFVNGAELARYSQAGVVTPDHTIRTKNWPLIVPAPEAGKLDDFKRAARAGGRGLRRRTTRPISRATTRASAAARRMLDPLPRVVLVPGLGLFGLGRSHEGRRASPPISPKPRSRPSPTPRRSAASSRSPKPTCSTCEYWSLEQAKLGTAKELPLAGQVAVVTGAGGAIGAATAQGVRARRAPRSRCSTSTTPRRASRRRRSAARRSRSPAT